MNKQPSHLAYVVTEAKPGPNQKSHWHRVGAAWPHKDGIGFDIVITEGLSVYGRIVCTERKDKPELANPVE